MRQTLTLIFTILTTLTMAAEYCGTFYVGDNFSQKNVRVEVLPVEQGSAASDGERIVVLRLHGVKFSRWMPVTIDLDIPEVKDTDGVLTLDRTNTIYKGESYTKKPATALRGEYDNNHLHFSVLLGDTQVRFE